MVSAKSTAAAPPAQAPAAESSRFQVAMGLSSAMLIAIVWIVTLAHVRDERAQDVDEAVKRNANLALTLEEQTIRTLKSTNQALSLVKHEFERTGRPPDIQGLVDKGALDDTLFDRIETADPRGDVAMGYDMPRVVNVADGDFFRYLAREPTNELFISTPIHERAPDRWVIRLARRLNQPDGSFAGVVFAAVNTAYFTRLYRRDDLGEQGLITLVGRRDGIVRATRIGDKATFGQDVHGTRLLAEQAKNPVGSFVGDDPAEGVPRFYSYRTLREYPFIVAVGTSVSEALAPFHDHARDYYLFAAIASAFIALIGIGSTYAIAQRVRAFNTLARSEARYREIFGHTKDGIVVLDLTPEGRFRITDSNRAFGELSGYSDTQLAGKLVEDVLSPDAAEALVRNIERCIFRGAAVSFAEDLEFLAGHRNLWITLVPIKDEAGAIRRVMAVIRDLTESNRAASALRSADAANQAKTAFLATMSNEIRAPLNGVLGMFQLLARTPLDRDQVMMLEAVQESGRSLLRTVEDVLDYSKIESGKLELKTEVTSIAQLVAGVASLYSGSATERGLLLVHATDERISGALMVDALRLRQVLSNFVSNAIKFTRQGQIEVKAELIERAEQHETVRFSVADTGVGIPEEDQKHLFQPFRPATAGSAERFGRIRLGLSICQRLATLMGGTVAVASEPGIGTLMTLTLRLAVTLRPLPSSSATIHAISRREAAPQAMPQWSELAAPEAAAPLLLLVVEPAVNRLILMRQVTMLGYTGELAENTAMALEMWCSGRFSLVIADVEHECGIAPALSRRIRALEKTGGGTRTPIIACCTEMPHGQGRVSADSPIDEFLTKPIELGKLAEKLRRWLPQWRPAPVARSASSPIDDVVLAEISAGDGALARDILLRFHRYNAEDASLLREAVRKADVDQVTHASHRIKGASKTVGAVELATICERLEHACRANDWETVAAHMNHFVHEFERLEEYIGTFEA
jgi:PAS domain S-box-containing protein